MLVQKEKNYVDNPSHPIDILKILSFSALIIFPVLGLLVNHLLFLGTISGIIYPLEVRKTLLAERARVVSIIGEDDYLNLTLFAFMGLLISERKIGEVKDEIKNKIVGEYLSSERTRAWKFADLPLRC